MASNSSVEYVLNAEVTTIGEVDEVAADRDAKADGHSAQEWQEVSGVSATEEASA